MMRALTPDEAVDATAAALGAVAGYPQTCIKPALRRAIYWLAPASNADIVRFVAEPLEPFGIERTAVEAALEELLAYGEAFEMHKLGTDPWDAPDIVIRPAPPSFVQRGDGSIMLLGIAGDQPTPLTPDLAAKVDEQGPVRRLVAPDDLVLAAHLRLLGLVQISEAVWLRTPTQESATAHVDRWVQRLAQQPREAAAIPNLEILDPARPVRFYSGRWRAPDARTTGIFLARRPRRYGADLWSIAEFSQGECHRLLDLRDDSDRQRSCDLGWRFQAARDALDGHPQKVRVRRGEDNAALDFFSPLPSFGDRRLALVGSKSREAGCLFSYTLPSQCVADETQALRDLLWMHAFDYESEP